MKYKLGVFGSSAGDTGKVLPRAQELGAVLAKYADSVIIITGACAGLPYAVARAAADKGVEIWGFSSEVDLDKQKLRDPDNDHGIYTKLIYVPEDYPLVDFDRARMKYRNVISTANCDAGIFISGRWGTLNEFTNLIDMQKIAGVLTGTGGAADELPALSQKISKAGQGHVIFNENPKILVEQLLSSLRNSTTNA
jgi:predicted Rossmann-fold nucleotide-binding protein